MAVPHLAEHVGRVLDGRYRVVAPIGNGASAAVFLADDVVLRRRVAIKVLHAALTSDQAFLKRFQAEAHTAAALSHPNIMRVLDWGEADDGPFLVLEYLGGGSLRGVLDASSTLSVEQAVSVGLQAARALDYAHRRGLVHRDVKPANLLFDEEARVAIADFGLARALAEAAWTEPGGAVLGTARYASPEQVRGQSLDGKSDVYALGLVLIEAVCGYVPFTADTTIATLMARLDVQLEAPTEMGPLGEIVERATNPDPAHRASAAELVSMLEAAQASLPAPERIELPGAIEIDITDGGGIDRTMLPGTAAKVTGAAAVPARIDTPTPEPSKRFIRGRRRKPQTNDEPAGLITTPKRRRMPSAKQVFVGLVIALLIGASVTGAYAVYFFTGSERPVPALIGMSLDQARSAAEQANVRLAYDGEEFSETVPAGQTFNQAPDEGGTVHPREPVHLKVSKGPAPRAVVNVTGQQVDPARQALAEKGFVVNTENAFDENAPTGKVLSQDPSVGELPKGTAVKLVVSAGPRPRTVPDLANKSYDEAVAALTALQLKVNKTEGFSDTVPAGQVAGTSPGPGASAARDSTVNIVVSKGPDLVAVPNVSGKSAISASATLQGSGFQVSNVYGPPTGTVFLTDPAAGTKVKRGTGINLYAK